MRRDRWDPQLDRDRPAFAPIRAAIEPFRQHDDWPTLDEWNAAMPSVRSSGGAPIRFVAQAPKVRGAPRDVSSLYDERIYTEGAVSSRVATWHDFFNMLVWASFPESKRTINERQRRALRAWIDPSQPRLPSARTEEQDVLAMIDEGGILVATARDDLPLDPEAIVAAAARGEAKVMILGHAIYEHLVLQPEEAVRGFVWAVRVRSIERDVDELRAELDVAFASTLREAELQRQAARGLPVTGGLFASER